MLGTGIEDDPARFQGEQAVHPRLQPGWTHIKGHGVYLPVYGQ
jgi:hypothetical protein